MYIITLYPSDIMVYLKDITASLLEIFFVQIICFYVYIPCHTAGKVENNVCTRVANCLCAHERVILVFISLVGNKHQNNTRVSAKTVRRKSTYIILFLTRHNVSKKWRLKRGSSHIIPVSHSLSLHSADDVTIYWWWRDNDQTIVTRTRDKWYLTR